MDATDDPITKLPERWWDFATGNLKKIRDSIIPPVEKPKEVSPAATFVDESFKHQAQADAKKRKKMMAQSVMTQDWDAPVLGNAGQL
jgi:hypothetical protein